MRHRLNRGGNRDANCALHMICVVRMGSDRRTQQYVARRTAEGEEQAGDHALPEALHHQGGLPRIDPAYRGIMIR